MTDTFALRFLLTEVLALAEHAAAAPDHRTSPYSDVSGPCLVWAKDDGTYLRSNGHPHLPGTDTYHHLVHADGWGRGTEGDLDQTPVGGDDFAEHFSLTAPISNDTDTTLLQDLRHAAAEGFRWLELEVGDDRVSIGYRT